MAYIKVMYKLHMELYLFFGEELRRVISFSNLQENVFPTRMISLEVWFYYCRTKLNSLHIDNYQRRPLETEHFFCIP